ncbi:hypothetical protein RHECNPAF_1740048 [Rhizobium etli CNPAF512]|nr:hypothetical protein RHECNPAF_1740048 [Rhizobium etli CNPAF512]
MFVFSISYGSNKNGLLALCKRDLHCLDISHARGVET